MRKAMGLVLLLCGAAAAGDVAANIRLPKPDMKGGMPLLQALGERKSAREFSAERLPPQVLSNLLWAAYGVNRDGRRTAPSARNLQTVDIYITLPEGAYLYRPRLSIAWTWTRPGRASAPTFRSQASSASAGSGGATAISSAKAPMNLVYVADFSNLANAFAWETQDALLGSRAGFVGQNVYLFSWWRLRRAGHGNPRDDRPRRAGQTAKASSGTEDYAVADGAAIRRPSR